MKRELKPIPMMSMPGGRHCKAYPDEKGIETWSWKSGPCQLPIHCKAYPDEKGIETFDHA